MDRRLGLMGWEHKGLQKWSWHVQAQETKTHGINSNIRERSLQMWRNISTGQKHKVLTIQRKKKKSIYIWGKKPYKSAVKKRYGGSEQKEGREEHHLLWERIICWETWLCDRWRWLQYQEKQKEENLIQTLKKKQKNKRTFPQEV